MKKTRKELLNIESISIEKYNFIKDADQNIVLGEGGSGIVFKVEQEFVPNAKAARAIKFFVFRDDLIDRLDTYISAENFDDEIVNISIFNHQNILKIIDGGYFQRDGVDIPYIVSDFIEGETLEELLENDELVEKYFSDKEAIFDLFHQILNGLIYLHNRSFYHCDIAPKNIFIHLTEEGFHVIIGDLGVGKTLKSNKNQEFLVTGTRDYMPQSVSNLKDTKVSFDKFKDLQPNWDIHALKLTFQECIRGIFKIELTAKTEFSWLNALISILDKSFKNLAEFEEAIERIKPIHRTIAGLPELSESDSGSWRKLVPLNDVLFTKRIKKIAEHPSLVRLRNVPQLLMGSIIFPGSNHSRYEHLLGTYENMRRVLIGLLKKEKFIELFSKEVLELALVSALLSNSTRFPFSFAIHELRNSDKRLLRKVNQKNLLEIILNYKEEENGFTYSLKETINNYFTFQDFDTVKNIICGTTGRFKKPEIQIIYSLLNSSIDVRVLDFLQRDAHHIGLSNGSQFDFESLVSFLDVYNNKIAVRSQGVSTVEQIISARYWLFKNIYWNEPNRSYTAMLKQIIYTLTKNDQNFEDSIIEKSLFSSPREVLNFFKSSAKNLPEILDMIGLITANRPRIYKRIYLVNKSEEDSVLSGICDKITHMSFKELNELRLELEDHLSSVIPLNEDKVNLLIDIPTEENSKLGKDINVIKYDNSVSKLTDLSGIVSGINNYFDSHVQWLRIYYHPDYKDKLKDNTLRKKMIKSIKQFLISKLG